MMQIGLSLPIEGGNQVLGRDVFYRFRDHSNQGLLAGKSVISSNRDVYHEASHASPPQSCITSLPEQLPRFHGLRLPPHDHPTGLPGAGKTPAGAELKVPHDQKPPNAWCFCFKDNQKAVFYIFASKLQMSIVLLIS